MTTARPAHFRFHNGGRKDGLPFAEEEYLDRLAGLREVMALHGLDAVVLTSMQNVAYYSGFLYCAFGRPYAAVITPTDCVTISAGLDGGQPWRRSIGDNISYSDGARDNIWRAVASVAGTGRQIGCEADHLTMVQAEKLNVFLQPKRGMDIAPATMEQRMRKSEAEIDLIRQGADVADIGSHAIRGAVRAGATELEVAIAGRDAMEREIAMRFPEAEYRDTGVWFQSGQNTDGAHNPVTNRRLRPGDILSLNCLPVISGYSAALERTMFLGEVDAASLKIWQANVAARDHGKSLLKPGVSCAEVAAGINAFLAERDLLQYCSFSHGQSLGLLSQYYGGEAALDLREDIDTVLEPGMVLSMAPTLTIPAGHPGAGGYRELDVLLLTEDGAETITRYPSGPEFNVIT